MIKQGNSMVGVSKRLENLDTEFDRKGAERCEGMGPLFSGLNDFPAKEAAFG
jgi:hypothetical protein